MGDAKDKSVFGGKRGWILIAGVAVGVALIFLGNGGGLMRQSEKNTDVSLSNEDALISYAEITERKIEKLCEGVCGVSEVRAIVTFAGDFGYTYATDSDTSEKDGTLENRQEYVTIGSGSSEQTVLLTRTPPTVNGIGIVCRGGGDANARKELISLLGAAFGVASNKIYIAEANP